MQYYGAFYRSKLHPLLNRINAYLMRWIRKKYTRLRTIRKAAGRCQSRRVQPAPATQHKQLPPTRAAADDDVVVHRYRPVMLAPNRREVGLPAVGIGRRR